MTVLQAYLDELFDPRGTGLSRALTLWREGVAHERVFWADWFATQGLSWREEYAERMQTRPLAAHLVALLPAGPARVIDVGAGPCTQVGNHVPGRDVEIIAVDPLADIYAELAAGITLPLPSRFAFGEDLSARFDPDSVDLVLCTNALDHAIAPVWCLIEMLLVARLGGRIILNHGVDEAEHEAYAGFHQWNFRADEAGHFIVWNRERRLDVTAMLAGFTTVECSTKDHYLTVVIEKRAAVPMDRGDYHRRMRAGLLRAALGM